MTIVIFIIILAFLIFIHELGHFLFAKFSGAGVEEFCVGFPPRAYSKKIGETVYSIGILPIGGFVKIVGEGGEELEKETNGAEKSIGFRQLADNEPIDFSAKTIWPAEKFLSNKKHYIQALVMAGGVLFNLLGAWILISTGSMFGLPTEISDSSFSKYIKNPKPMITFVAPDSPADLAGLKMNDSISNIISDDISLTDKNTKDIMDFIQNSNGELVLSISRATGEIENVKIQPEEINGQKMIGIGLSDVGNLKVPFYLSPIVGAKITWNITRDTVLGLSSIIIQSAKGHTEILKNVSGPVGIIQMVGTAREFGLASLIIFISIISVNLAVINLLPLPALDGGRLIMIAIEGTIRRKIKPQIAGMINGFGLIILLALMAIITFKDIANLF